MRRRSFEDEHCGATADEVVDSLNQDIKSLESKVARLNKKLQGEVERYADLCGKVVDATGIELPVGGMTAVEAVTKLRENCNQMERQFVFLRDALRAYVDDDECQYGSAPEDQCGPDDDPCRRCRGMELLKELR